MKFSAFPRSRNTLRFPVGLELSLLSSGVSGCLANPRGVYVYSGCSVFPTNHISSCKKYAKAATIYLLAKLEIVRLYRVSI